MARESFDERYETEASAHVLEHGLAAVPAEVGLRQIVPVAYWLGPDLGAVMHVRWSAASGKIDDYLDAWIQVVSRGQDGWQEVERFGRGEFERPLAQPEIAPRAVEDVHSFGGGNDDVWYSGIAGVAGRDGAFLEVADGESAVRRPLDSPIGVFVTCWSGRGRRIVRVLDRAGDALFECPVEFPDFRAIAPEATKGSGGISAFSGRATAALSDGRTLGEVFVMLQRSAEWDSEGRPLLVDGEVAYESWWGYLEFLEPVPRHLMREVEDFDTVVISGRGLPRRGPPGDPIRVTQVTGGDIEGRRRFLVHETEHDDDA